MLLRLVACLVLGRPNFPALPKWYKDDKDLKKGDLVYMKKSPDNKLDSAWVVGVVEQVIPSRD